MSKRCHEYPKFQMLEFLTVLILLKKSQKISTRHKLKDATDEKGFIFNELLTLQPATQHLDILRALLQLDICLLSEVKVKYVVVNKERLKHTDFDPKFASLLLIQPFC